MRSGKRGRERGISWDRGFPQPFCLFVFCLQSQNGSPVPFPLQPVYCLQLGLLSFFLEQASQSTSAYPPVLKGSMKSSLGFLRVPTIRASVLSCVRLCSPMACSSLALSMGFSRQEDWSGLPFPPLGPTISTRWKSWKMVKL